MVLGELGFFAIWLLGWSAGVSFIQYSVLSEGFSSGFTPFLFTHGAAQVIALWAMSSRIRAAAEDQVNAPRLERDHAGMRARWVPGSGSLLVAAAATALGAIVHAMLIGVPALLLTSLAPASAVLALALCGVWLGTAWMWFSNVLTHVRMRREVRLDADLDRVRIEQDGSDPVDLPLVGLDATGVGDMLSLASSGTYWRSGCKDGPERAELVEVLRAMAARATPPEAVEEPEALRRMRGEVGETG